MRGSSQSELVFEREQDVCKLTLRAVPLTESMRPTQYWMYSYSLIGSPIRSNGESSV